MFIIYNIRIFFVYNSNTKFKPKTSYKLPKLLTTMKGDIKAYEILYLSNLYKELYY